MVKPQPVRDRVIARKPIHEGSELEHSRGSCERKALAFTTRREAWFALREKRRERQNEVDPHTGVYQCKWCGFWHWGRRNEA